MHHPYKFDNFVLSSYIVRVYGERDGTIFTDDINEAYEKIIFWLKKLFMLSAGNAGKKHIKELTRPLNVWTQNTSLRSISLEAIYTMPALL